MKTLVLVDGSSYLYRAFHALPDLRNRLNEPTGAIYGVLNMLRRLYKEYQPDYSACVFDAKGKTFREEIYPQYKANRPPMPADLAGQINPLYACIRAMGWPLLVEEQVEADDVIGTLARRAAGERIQCVISTGDKDIAQLVAPGIRLVNTMNSESLDEAGVLQKFGVMPAQIIDFLALVGDSVDNIPGVEKVGPKTAVKWLNQYGSLNNLIAHAHEIKGVVGENLRKALDWLQVSRELLTIKCDVPLAMGWQDLVAAPLDVARLMALYEHLEFRSWLRELRQSDSETGPATIPMYDPLVPGERNSDSRDYQIILTDSQFEEWVQQCESAELVSIDTETTSLNPMEAELVGLSLCTEPGHAAYIPLAHHYQGVPSQLNREQVLQRLKPWLENSDIPKVGQNLKYDRHVFANHGVMLNGIAHDTLLQSYVLESHLSHDLDSLARRHLDIQTISYDDVTGKGAKRIGFEQVEIQQAGIYAAEDADIPLRLHHFLYPIISKDAHLGHIYQQIEMPLLEVLFRIERNGVLLDTDLLREQSGELARQLVILEQQAHSLAGRAFNLNSTKQIQEILFGQHKLPVIKKTPKGAPSTDEEVLQQLALDYPLPKILLDYRSLAKLRSTYIDKLPQMVNRQTGRVHTNYAQAVAVTGRLASNDPNLQNIPVRTPEGRRIREAFIAPSGWYIISADYSQIELRIMAHISQDAGLIRAFLGGQDIHSATAAEVFGISVGQVNAEQRRYAKVINFGLIYGMSEFGLATQLGIDRSAARAFIDRYFARYPGVADYMQRTRELARQNGYVETVLGRRLQLPDIRSSQHNRRMGAERAAINAPMQGTAADIIKLAMISVHQWLVKAPLQSKLIMQVHDELVLEVIEDELFVVKENLIILMENTFKLDVPLKVEVGVGKNWDQAH
ncbi:DNA polymerase I [Nitrosomonas eutropha]|uniref:DNA polymerase I n=2 Tax=Nitrosomonas eutropha TaxID=916 RepID=A0ABX5MBZ4_9PROT|nr:DNA polymerase I [Nitrosomonas eutropha]ABI59048.1 DNA polymerase I [Nitrosomonas eutropha C91]PXV83993.1 DNA polymerase I [Nitrosomonas eutropha]SEI46485.1 DNA polymerase I [Nitrosomonas eutropha]